MSVVTLHSTDGREMARLVDPPDPTKLLFEIEHTGRIGSVWVDGIPVRQIPEGLQLAMAKGWRLDLEPNAKQTAIVYA